MELKKRLYSLRMLEGGEVVGVHSAVDQSMDLWSLGVMEIANP